MSSGIGGRIGAGISDGFRFFKTLAIQSVKEFMDDNCMQLAAAISYYVLFALFPLLIFLTGAAGVVLQNSDLEQDIIDAVLDFIPLTEDEGRNRVTDAVRDVSGGASGVIGALGLLGMAWAGSNMFAVIRRSLNHAYDIESHRPFVQQKLIDLGLVIGVGFFFLCSIAATAFLRSVRQFSADLGPLGEFADDIGPAWDFASILVPFGLSFAAFLVLYWIVPNQVLGPKDVWPGALVAAVMFEAAKFGFSIYLETIGQGNAVFGALGGVAIFLFWVYISANILLFGAEVASEYPRVRAGAYDKPEEETEPEPLREKVRKTVRGLFIEDKPR